MTAKILPLSSLPKNILDARAGFDCGNATLNRYLAAIASQHDARNITRVFCGVFDGELAGFYALSNSDVDVSALSHEVIKRYKLPAHRLPVVRLARLAVDRRFQGRGFGQGLVVDAMRRVVRVSNLSGCVGLTVDAKDAQAADFYQSFGFRLVPCDGLLLFMPLPEIRALINE